MKQRISLIYCFQITTLLVAASEAGTRNASASTNWNLLPENCGVAMDKRIIGGKQVSALNGVPWIARLGFREVTSTPCPNRLIFLCGGTLISKRYVVSAAHCFSVHESKCHQCKLALQVVRLGEVNVETNPDCIETSCNEGYEDYNVSKIVVHSRFSPDYFYNDIALVRVDRDVRFSAYIYPICLLKGRLFDKDYVEESLHIAGWGLKKVFPEKESKILKEVSMKVTNKSDCGYSYEYQVAAGQICLLSTEYETGPCKGDEGGPASIFETEEGRWFIVGIMSFIPRVCGNMVKPLLATYLPVYTQWLLDNLQE
ncbi:hypothetical protein QAD02_017534 [Eretmocerus hayati]|uniref:Uncharacterized protein n=1 Tax=Eretmocerus hayati TaxID=131215 RepID=A0ACC2PEJ0_9HYME|nr:hypothetical protein QAD02_017534 [Eretmocerus hayati]